MLTAAGLPHRHRDPRCPQSDSASGRWRCPGDQHPELLPANPCGGPGANQNRKLQGLDWPDLPGDPFAHTEGGDGNRLQPPLPQTPGQREGGTQGLRKGWPKAGRGSKRPLPAPRASVAPSQRGAVYALIQVSSPRNHPIEGSDCPVVSVAERQPCSQAQRAVGAARGAHWGSGSSAAGRAPSLSPRLAPLRLP